ncbi:FecR family protein [Pedobacter changchengzhani]|uniref:FecR family protein n=1 Tax=Pedobacter changchengzhani TaxID=2529274 RepID=A0A4R5MNV7_9SPHI|nr:FecR family protein [Pedobacter changchengzhani]TDG37520.1 FecR family protein [Pedobacter changchengzhani]
MNVNEIKNLLDKYLSGNCNEEELRRVEEWLDRENQSENEWTRLSPVKKEEWLSSLFKSIKTKTKHTTVVTIELAKVLPIYKKVWFKCASIAAVLLIGLIIGYNQFTQKPTLIVLGVEKVNNPSLSDNKAMLTLSDGSSIILDSASDGKLASQGNSSITKSKGKLTYSAVGKNGGVVFNTISTLRGGQYHLVLPDGTKVWLNAASSLHFPTRFSGKERNVRLTGEAYFEVAKNGAMPFKVDVAGKGEVKVLGTHFNVNAYADEPTINTTLLEGSVQFSIPSSRRGGLGVRITPGEQVQLTKERKLSVNKRVDVETVMAWKNDKFIFNSTDLETIMRQLERWYDVTVYYKNGIPKDEFVGIISRNVKISEILKMLETTGSVKFEIKGKTIIVQ